MNTPTVKVKHACGCIATYPAQRNDPNGDIATGMSLQLCFVCANPSGDWMDVQGRAERKAETKGRYNP